MLYVIGLDGSPLAAACADLSAQASVPFDTHAASGSLAMP